jgi:hypothetical protein
MRFAELVQHRRAAQKLVRLPVSWIICAIGMTGSRPSGAHCVWYSCRIVITSSAVYSPVERAVMARKTCRMSIGVCAPRIGLSAV